MRSVIQECREAIPITPEVKRFGYVLGLPLIDGVFITLVLAGVLDTIAGIVLVGAIVFTGSGAIAVLLSDLSAEPRRHLVGVLLLGATLIPVAGIQGALAPMIASGIDVTWLTWVAAIVLLILGARMGSRWLHRRLPNPRLIVVVGVVISLRPASLVPNGTVEGGLAVAGAGAATVGIVLAVAILFLGSRLQRLIRTERFRFGGGVALGVLGISLVTAIPTHATLVVLALAFLLSIEERTVEDVQYTVLTSGEEPIVDSEMT